MHFFILPQKDTTLYEGEPTLNSGLDACLELSKTVATQQNPFNPLECVSESIVSRILIKFDLTELRELIASGDVTASEVYLNLFASEGKEIPLSYTIFAHPVSQSWEMGTSYRDNVPFSTNGASWNTRDGETKWLNTGSLAGNSTTGSDSVSGSGGTWYTSSVASQSFEFQFTDIAMNVTSIVNQWLNNEIPNDGFILKFDNDDEINDKQLGSFGFYSNETHTIYRPVLEVVWDDSVHTVSTSSTTLNVTESSSISADIITNVVTHSFVTGALGSEYSNAGNPASGALTFATISSGRRFELTDTTGSVYTYSASDDPVPADSGSVFYFATGSSLSEGIQNLVDEINNISGSSVVSASLSGSDTLALVAAFSGTQGNLVTFSGSLVTLEGGTDLFISESINHTTESIYSFSQSLGLYTSCSFATESDTYTSGSQTYISSSVTTESVCVYTAALGPEFQQVGENFATGSTILSPISESVSFSINDTLDSWMFVATSSWATSTDAAPTYSFAVEASTGSMTITSIAVADQFIVSSSIGEFTFSASAVPVLPDTASLNIYGFEIGVLGDISITQVSASDLFSITGSDNTIYQYSAALPWNIPSDSAPTFYFGISHSTGALDIPHISSSNEFQLTSSCGCVRYTYIATSSVQPDSGNIFYFLTGSDLSESIENLVDEINNSDANQFVIASFIGNVIYLSGSDDNVEFAHFCESVTLKNASISESVQNLVDEINNSTATFISASKKFDSVPVLGLTSSTAPVTFQSASFQTALNQSNISESLGRLVNKINEVDSTFLTASYNNDTINLSGSENGITFKSGSTELILSGRDGIQNLVDEINASEATSSVSASADGLKFMLTASNAGTAGNVIQFTGSSFVLEGGTDSFVSIASESLFSSFSFDPNTGIYTSESYTFVSESFEFTSESVTTIISSSFDQRLLELDDDGVVNIINLKEVYRQDSMARFEVFARERFPIKEFVTGSWSYTRNPRALPPTTFYSIRDAYTEEEIVPFSDYTKISFDNGSYFNLWMRGYEPERFYRILIKIVHDDIENIYDKDFIFKVIR